MKVFQNDILSSGYCPKPLNSFSTSQFRSATFQMPHSHMWLMATASGNSSSALNRG